ncbi:ribonuclease Z [Enterococcus asini]|uniref:ribonuclease Z n=1 Tax=Enterococcus TaxID=1350 RepID=UPI0028911C94|nr:ribonuclease Z [Enterococcus asini]MDT2757805.1 ribonuclease Z [Enterococcus asini]
MEIEFLGTGAGVPAKHRNVTGIALKLLAERNGIWLFDCGEGTQMQILRTTIRPRKIEKIFITHLHGDHIFGLPGLLSSRSFQGGVEPMEIYGPKGVKDFVLTALRVSQTRLAYPLKFIEVAPGVIFQDQQFTVICDKLDHGIDSYGYRVEEADHEGELQVDKLLALGIKPGPIFGQLKRGENVTLPDGSQICGKDFVGQRQTGRIVTILGDTRYTPSAIELGQNADILVHESTFKQDESQMAKSYYHSTTAQAAQVAQKAHVKQLLLTHISARYLAKDVAELEKEARSVFANTRIVRDFDVIDVPFSRKDETDGIRE